MQCDVPHQACLKNGFPVKFFWKVPVQPELIEQIEPRTTVEDQQVEEDTQKYLKGIKGFFHSKKKVSIYLSA